MLCIETLVGHVMCPKRLVLFERSEPFHLLRLMGASVPLHIESTDSTIIVHIQLSVLCFTHLLSTRGPANIMSGVAVRVSHESSIPTSCLRRRVYSRVSSLPSKSLKTMPAHTCRCMCTHEISIQHVHCIPRLEC